MKAYSDFRKILGKTDFADCGGFGCNGYRLFALSVGATSFGGGSGAEDFGSAKNLILGTITLVCCIGFNIFAKSYGNSCPYCSDLS